MILTQQLTLHIERLENDRFFLWVMDQEDNPIPVSEWKALLLAFHPATWMEGSSKKRNKRKKKAPKASVKSTATKSKVKQPQQKKTNEHVLEELPHLQTMSPEWQAFYLKIRETVKKET